MQNTHNRFWLIAGDKAVRAGDNNSRMHMEVQGHTCPTPNPKCLHVKIYIYIYIVRYLLIRLCSHK